MFAKRLNKELLNMERSLPPGISIADASDLENWYMDIRVLDENPLYKGEIYRLKLNFSNKYPIEPPEVTFVKTNDPPRKIPMHPHIYDSGIICLDLLSTTGWSPVQNVESICVSLQSMLTGNTRNERPEGNEQFVATNKRRPRDIDSFVYDDDKV